MRVRVNAERCMGNGVCIGIAPEAFRIDDEGYAEVIVAHPEGELAVEVTQAARLCPTNAIEIDEA